MGVLATALAAHYVLGVTFGTLLVAVSAPLRLDSTVGIAMLTGAVFGATLYLVNFYVMVYLFPWFAAIRGWATFVAHLIIGMSAAVLYWKLERRGEAREAAQKSA